MDSAFDTLQSLVLRSVSIALALWLLFHWQRWQPLWHSRFGRLYKLVALTTLLWVVSSRQIHYLPLLVLILALSLLPEQWQRLKRRAYQKELSQHLPHFLDLVVLALQSGQSLPQALQRLVQSDHGCLGADLRQVMARHQRGMSLDDSLRQWAEACALAQVRWVVEAWVIGQRSGGAIAEGLSQLAERLLQERLRQAEASANQLPLKLLAPLFICIFPSTFLLIFFPIAWRLLH